MTATGNTVKIDSAGRIVIPKALRKKLEVEHFDTLEFFFDDDKLILKKYSPSCIFCGECSETVTYMDKQVCKNCADKLKKLAEINSNQ